MDNNNIMEVIKWKIQRLEKILKEKYLECGFDDYLSKTIEKVELYRVVYKYLNKK